MQLLAQSAVYLASAVVAVPLFKRLGLGSTLGYLAAGVVIGPSALGLVSDPESILHFAELGVVLLLFLVGLELEPERLSALRRRIFGLGGFQVGLTTLLFGAAAFLVGRPLVEAGVIGAGLALSSTALALQVLGERGDLHRPYGRATFAILLFHDMAVIPMLAVVPMLGDGGGRGGPSPLIALGTLVGVVVAGKYLVRPFLRLAAGAQSSEVSTAAALFVVVGTALLMEEVGLSMALGAFLAGVLLADSEYRHELEANIQPFKGLLLGLFFIAIGMSAKLRLVAESPLLVVGLVLSLVAGKAIMLVLVGRVAELPRRERIDLAVALSHGGVFAFLLFGVAADSGVLPRDVTDLLVVVVAVSMAFTPLLFALRDAMVRRFPGADDVPSTEETPYEDAHVVIAGFGRFGQIVGRVLATKRIAFTAIEADAGQVDFVRRYGSSVHFGDTTRVEILRASGVADARVFVLAVDDMEASVETARVVRSTFPGVPVVARARNRRHAFLLMELGVDVIFRETFASSLEAAREVLIELGLPTHEAYRAARKFREHDERVLEEQFHIRDDTDALVATTLAREEQLRQLFEWDEEPARPFSLGGKGAVRRATLGYDEKNRPPAAE